MANTIDTALIVDVLSETAITTLGNKLASFSAFTGDFSNERALQAGKIQIPVATTGDASQKNPTNFETGDSTLSKVAVTIDHYSKSFVLSSAAMNQALKIEMLAKKALQIFAQGLYDIALTPVTTTNFPTAISLASVVATNTNDLLFNNVLKPVFARLAKASERHVILNGSLFAQSLPQNVLGFKPGGPAFGFDGVHLSDRFDGSESNTVGFGCSPEAIAIASMLPMKAPGADQEFIASEVVPIDSIGLSVELNMWYSRATRSLWASYDVLFGAAFGGDASKGVLVKTTSGS
jgi:hypothetical protein